MLMIYKMEMPVSLPGKNIFIILLLYDQWFINHRVNEASIKLKEITIKTYNSIEICFISLIAKTLNFVMKTNSSKYSSYEMLPIKDKTKNLIFNECSTIKTEIAHKAKKMLE
ncbi:hypothetical protein N752_00085 [Desulforamulus aquiferis]|nr:hypothetical protein N752_00085 [Desulforamulus aquiferis]